jgi:hypothetical protein
MAELKDLPGGKKFTAFGLKKKLKASTRRGELQNLSDNQAAINAFAKKRQKVVRSGQYDSFRKRADYQEILRDNPNLTKQDKKDIKELFEHWSRTSEGVKKEAVVEKELTTKKGETKKPKPLQKHINELLPRHQRKGSYSTIQKMEQRRTERPTTRIYRERNQGNASVQGSSTNTESSPKPSTLPPKLVR